MAIVDTINSVSQFRGFFEKMDRDYFSYDAYETMFNYYDNLSGDSGENIEMDVIAFCGEWNQYDDADEVYNEYSNVLDSDGFAPKGDDEDEDEFGKRLLAALDNYTTVYHLKDGKWLLIAF